MHPIRMFVIACLLPFGVAQAQTKTAPSQPAKPPAAATPAAATAAGTSSLKPGLWELTTVVETPGSPSKRTVVGRACYGGNDVADPPRIVPQQREFGMQCENREVKTEGTNATWKIACTSKESSLSGTGKMAMSGATYSGKAELEMKKKGAKPVKVEQSFTGKWIEPCK